MRIYVFIVFCLSLNNMLVQTSNQKSTLDSKDLCARVKSVKESVKSKKDKFSCILNLLKNALVDELNRRNETDPNMDESDVKQIDNIENNFELDYVNNKTDEIIVKDGTEKDICEILVTKPDNKVCPTDSSWDFPTMIPIFKPKPVMSDVMVPTNQLAPIQEPIQVNLKPINEYPAFTIPCHRAADILDMTVPLKETNNMPNPAINLQTKEEIISRALTRNTNEIMDLNIANELNNHRDITHNNMNKHISKPPRHINLQLKDLLPIEMKKETKQPSLKFTGGDSGTPKTLSVNCVDADESISVSFKPKAITLEQLYGNLLKKITITVLVPYHMSKMKSICEV